MEATIGGTKRHLVDLASGLDGERLRVEVACPPVRSESHGDTSFVDDLRAAPVAIHALPMRRALHPLHDARAILGLARLIRSGGYDIVHTHSTKAGVTGRLAAVLSAARVVHTPHGFYFLNSPRGLRRAAYRLLERALGGVTDRLIALSPSERRVAESIVSAGKVRLIPNSFERFQPLGRAEARRRLGLPDDVPVVGTTARFTPQKAPFDIVDAFAEIHRRRPDVRFVWINGGELRGAVERRLAAHGLLERTARPGYLADARALLPAMDVYLHLARWEGVPYSVMEAMTAGVPVVGARAVGTLDLIEDRVTGLLVPVADGAGAGRAALHLLTYPDEASNIARNARRAVADRLDPTTMIRATEAVYLELVGRS